MIQYLPATVACLFCPSYCAAQATLVASYGDRSANYQCSTCGECFQVIIP